MVGDFLVECIRRPYVRVVGRRGEKGKRGERERGGEGTEWRLRREGKELSAGWERREWDGERM